MVVAERGRRRRFPHDRVAHQRRRGRQVTADGREVEWRDRVDEPLERTVIHPVPHPGRGVRLLPVDLLGVVHVEAEEIDQLAGAVDLRLIRRLALAQHRGGIDDGAMRRRQQLGRLEEHRRPVLESPVRPVALGFDGGAHGGPDRRRIGLVRPCQHSPVRMGRDYVHRLSGPDLPATRDDRDLDLFRAHQRERGLERLPLGGPGRIGQHRLIDGKGNVGRAVHRITAAREWFLKQQR